MQNLEICARPPLREMEAAKAKTRLLLASSRFMINVMEHRFALCWADFKAAVWI
jgi:hypothetical protein